MIRNDILKEAHLSHFSVYLGATKMYTDMRNNLWWSGMKRDMADFVDRCMVCQQVKAEHQRLAGLLKPLEVP